MKGRRSRNPIINIDERIYLRNVSNISKLRLNHSVDYVIFSADLNAMCLCGDLLICQHGPI